MPAPKKNVAFSFVLPLVDSANRPAFKANPTLAAGDFKHSGDGSALTNLGTLPTVDPASSRLVKIVLSQSEMNYDRVTIQCVDASGGEWDEVLVTIDTTAVTVDDLVRSTTPANALTVESDGMAHADVKEIEGADATNQIRDSVVDDATRIDASALNTLSGHDPGETIMGATDLGTGTGFTAIPWNAAWGAEVQGECADALAAYGASTVTAAQVNAEVDSALADYDPPTHAELVSEINSVQTDVAALNDLDAAGVRAALGLANADLDAQLASIKADTGTTLPGTLVTIASYIDTEVAAIKAKTDLIPASPASVGDIPTADENADALLKRDWSAVSGESDRSVLNALRKLRNEWSISGNTLTVKKEDDSTTAYTQTLTGTAGAEPITAIDN